MVTGASGFVGRHLVPALAEQHEVVCLARDRLPEHDSATAVILADLTSPDFVDELPKVDVVVHLAQAYRQFPEHSDQLFRVNTGSTQVLAEWGRRAGIQRFVLASSGSVYRPGPAPLREHDATEPFTFHPATKLAAELILRHYLPFFSVSVLRLFAPYGPRQVNRLIPRMIDSVSAGRPIGLSRGGEPRINPIYVDDLVGVIAQSIGHRDSYTVNVAGPEAADIRELAERIGRQLGRSPSFERRDADPEGNFVADTTLMHRTFAVPQMTTLDDGLRSMIAAQVPAGR